MIAAHLAAPAPTLPSGDLYEVPRRRVAEGALTAPELRYYQAVLAAYGHYTGALGETTADGSWRAADGVMGPATRAAVLSFQRQHFPAYRARCPADVRDQSVCTRLGMDSILGPATQYMVLRYHALGAAERRAGRSTVARGPWPPAPASVSDIPPEAGREGPYAAPLPPTQGPYTAPMPPPRPGAAPVTPVAPPWAADTYGFVSTPAQAPTGYSPPPPAEGMGALGWGLLAAAVAGTGALVIFWPGTRSTNARGKNR